MYKDRQVGRQTGERGDIQRDRQADSRADIRADCYTKLAFLVRLTCTDFLQGHDLPKFKLSLVTVTCLESRLIELYFEPLSISDYQKLNTKHNRFRQRNPHAIFLAAAVRIYPEQWGRMVHWGSFHSWFCRNQSKPARGSGGLTPRQVHQVCLTVCIAVCLPLCLLNCLVVYSCG